MKIVLLIFLFLNFPFLVYSQFNVGMKGGVTFSNIIYDASFDQNTIETQIKPGIMGGLSFQYINPKNAGLQFELLYIQKGFSTKFDSVNNTQYERSIDYISLPFLMHVSFGKKRFQVSLILGPYGSYAIYSREILTDGMQKIDRSYQFDPDTDNRLEFGLQGGVGFRHKFNFGIIEVQGNLSFTFTSLFKWEAINKDPEMDRFFKIPEMAQSQVYQLALSYYYPF